MPVQSAGPRLYNSVRFKHLVKKAGSATSARPANVALNLTPFVDMMTILVAFLLMVFSAAKLMQVQANLDLPQTTGKPNEMQDAPVIVISKSEITYQGEMIVTTDTVLRDDSPNFTKIEALFERLQGAASKIHDDVKDGKIPDDLKKACEDAKQNVRPTPGHVCPEGLAILQADEGTDTRIINKVVLTAKAAGFDNLLFAVKNK